MGEGIQQNLTKIWEESGKYDVSSYQELESFSANTRTVSEYFPKGFEVEEEDSSVQKVKTALYN